MSCSKSTSVEIVEVGPRDGLQGVGPFVPTAVKLELINAAIEAGIGRVEIGSFVSEKAVPQLRDTPQLLASCGHAATQVLVPTKQRGEQAAKAGANWIAYVVSVSEAHNHANLKRPVDASMLDYQVLAETLPASVNIRFNVATAFDCPFDGRIEIARTMKLIERALDARQDVEICLCDTTGRANPAHVGRLFETACRQFPEARSWAFHGHDTYGLGIANVYAAFAQGVRVFDAAFGGLGGCPFAPGATGNVATEDVAYLFDSMGIHTGVAFEKLLVAAQKAIAIPGAVVGGRVRQALAARLGACT